MTIFSAYRGSHIKVPFHVNSSSMIKLEGTDGLLRTDNIFVSNFYTSLSEKASVIQCFKDYNYIFAYGHDPVNSQYSVEFTAFLLGESCTSFKSSGIIKKIKEYYDSHRVSKLRKLVKLTIGDLVVKGILVNMQITGANAELNTVSIKMTLMGIEGVSNGK